jgi:hypothetical protein
MRLYQLSQGGRICSCQGGRLYGLPIKGKGTKQNITNEIKEPINEPIPNIEQLQNKLSRLSTTKLKGKNKFISL